MLPEAAKTIISAIPEIQEEVEKEAVRQGKPLCRMWADVLQNYWAIPLWVLAALEVYKLWPK